MCELCPTELVEFLRDPFHSAALAAYVEVAVESGQRVPDREAVRQRAYRLYEENKRQKGSQP